MNDRDPTQPDPLRDGKNWDAAKGLVTFHQLQRRWDASREETPDAGAGHAPADEITGPDPPIASERIRRKGNRFTVGLIAIFGLLLLVVTLLFLALGN